MSTRSARLLVALALPLLVAGVARADPPLEELRRELADTLDRWRAERSIERSMVEAEVRGRLAGAPPAPDWTPREWGGGRLVAGPGGVPILHVAGTPEEMGAQHGHLLGGELQGMLRYVEAFVGRRELPAARRRARELFEAHTPPRYLREVEALAAAAGLDVEDVLFAQWFTDLYRGFACSTLTARSAEGPFLARNLDFPGMGWLGRYSVVVVARPEGRRPFVSVTWPGLIGVLSGQSPDVALSVMVVHDDLGARPGLPFQLAFRRVLEEAGSAAEVEALLRETPLTVSNNLMVLDGAGDARALELHAEAGVVARLADDRGRLACTNHFLSGRLRSRRLSLTYFSSQRRYRVVAAAASREGELTLADGRAALAEAATSFTQQAMVFLPAHGALEVALSGRPPATDAEFVRLEARHLLGE